MDGVFNFPVWTFSFYINSKIIQLLKTTDMNTFILSKGFQVSFVCVFFFFYKVHFKAMFPRPAPGGTPNSARFGCLPYFTHIFLVLESLLMSWVDPGVIDWEELENV